MNDGENIVKRTDNVPCRLLPIRQWSHGKSCTWAHDLRLSNVRKICIIISLYIQMYDTVNIQCFA